MTRFRYPLSLALVLVVVAAGPWASASSGGGGRDPGSPAEARRIRSYWTPARMVAARPVPLPVVPGKGPRSPLPRPSGPPGHVAATDPQPSSSTATDQVTREASSEDSQAELSTVGKVFMTDPATGINYVCSGTSLTSGNSSVVWTAGHCVYNDGYFVNWAFAPGYEDGSAPYGVWPALELRAPAQWRAAENLRYDFATAVVSPNSAGQRLTSVVGGRGFLWNAPVEQIFEAYGYPAAPPYSGGRVVSCLSPYAGPDYPSGEGPPTMSITCSMTGGSSGGGWIVGDAVNSNISYGRTSKPGLLFGPYLGDVAAALYQESSASGAPDAVPSPSPTPTATPTASPSPTPTPTAPNPTPSASPTSSPAPTPTPSPTPQPSPTPTPNPTPSASPTSSPGPTPTPSPTSDPQPSPSPEPTPDPDPTPEPEPSPPPQDPETEPVLVRLSDRPDPFSPDGDRRRDRSRIRFTLTRPALVSVRIFRRNGSHLVTLVRKKVYGGGDHVVRWDGRNRKGRIARRGLYRYRIKVDPAQSPVVRARGRTRLIR